MVTNQQSIWTKLLFLRFEFLRNLFIMKIPFEIQDKHLAHWYGILFSLHILHNQIVHLFQSFNSVASDLKRYYWTTCRMHPGAICWNSIIRMSLRIFILLGHRIILLLSSKTCDDCRNIWKNIYSPEVSLGISQVGIQNGCSVGEFVETKCAISLYTW